MTEARASIPDLAPLKARPEHELLMWGAQPLPSTHTKEQFRRLLQQPIDWGYLLPLIIRHGVTPLWYQTVSQSQFPEVPPWVVARLQERVSFTIRRNLFITGELARIYRTFAEAGVSVVPFKGPVLAQRLYGNLGRREFSDLDLLIYPADNERAKQLLAGCGYAYRRRVAYEYVYHLPDPELFVEVHWRAISLGNAWLRSANNRDFPFDLASLQPRLATIAISGDQISCLGVEDLLLLLCIHGAKHRWRRLSWVSDVAALLVISPTLDWDWVLSTAGTWHVKRMLSLGLFLAHSFLAAPLPDAIQMEMNTDPKVPLLAEQVVGWLYHPQSIGDKLFGQPIYFRQLWERRRDRWSIGIAQLAVYGQMLLNRLVAGRGRS